MLGRIGVALVILSLGSSIAAAQLPEIAYFPFEGPATPTNLAPQGAGVTFPAAGYAYAPAQIGNGLGLASLGGNSGVTAATNLVVAGDWTIECWNVNDANPSLGLPGFGQPTSWSNKLLSGGPNGNFSMGEARQDLFLPRYFYFGYSGGGFPGFYLDFGSTTPSTWKHIAVSYEAATRTLRGYKNGVLIVTVVAAGDVILRAPSGIDLGMPWDGKIDELRIWSQCRSQSEIMQGMNVAAQPAADDLRIEELIGLTSPTGCGTLGTAETITMRITNYGANSIPAGTMLTASYSIDGGPVVVESQSLPILMAYGDHFDLSFSTPANLASFGQRRIALTCNASQTIAGLQAARSLEIASGAPGAVGLLPWVETFPAKALPLSNQADQLPPGWEVNLATQSSSWWVHYAPGQLNGHTEPGIPYGDSTLQTRLGVANAPSVLTPCIDLGAAWAPEMGLWVRSAQGTGTATVTVDIEDLSTNLYHTAIASLSLAASSQNWMRLSADISAFSGHQVRLVFLYSATAICYIEIDDVSIIDTAIQGMGQAPHSVSALLEIDYSFGVGHDRPRSGDAGPYFAQTRVGDQIDFRFEGEPHQWVVLFWGQLNPASINYGAVGLCDVGTGFDAMTGLPLNIWILGNGLQPVAYRDFLFLTDVNGMLFLSTITPPLAVGSNGAFQALIGRNGPPWMSLSNAVELLVR